MWKKSLLYWQCVGWAKGLSIAEVRQLTKEAYRLADENLRPPRVDLDGMERYRGKLAKAEEDYLCGLISKDEMEFVRKRES
jgi:hypothetical protein